MRLPGTTRQLEFGSGNPARSRHNALKRNSSSSALTASGFRVTHQDTDMMRRLIQPWQSRAFAYYDLLGEIKYAAQFYARMLSPLKLYAAEKNADGDWVESENPDAIAALERVQDPGGGRTNLLGSYGRLMFLAGECVLLVTKDPDTDLEQWEMLSTDECRIQSGMIIRYKAPSLYAEEFREPAEDDWEPLDDKTAIPYRIWKRHPRYSMLADSTMQGVLDLCEELVLLTQAVRARARSRLAGSGVLFISNDFSHKPLEPVPDEDPQEDPFLADLTEAMTLPIVDEGTASAVVPLVVRGPTDAIEKGIKHIQIIDPTQLYPETGLRMECIKRISIGLDMPPEILLGMADANHWTGWMIDEQTWKNHGLPIAVQFCEDVTQAYFRPYLREIGVANPETFAILFDATDVINHPDRGKDAKDLFDRVAIGHEALRTATGFDETDAPTQDERAERIGILTRDSSLAWFGEPAPRGGAVETGPGVIVSDQVGDTATSPSGPATGAEVEKGPPATEPAQEPITVTASLDAARILGAADLALLRAREMAGNRLKGYAKRNPDMLKLIETVRTSEVACALGRENVRSLRVPPERELVAGSRDLIADSLRVWGINDPAVADLVAENVEQHAARTLYDKHPSPLPESFTNYLAGVAAGVKKS